jgi:hypothetical protein
VGKFGFMDTITFLGKDENMWLFFLIFAGKLRRQYYYDTTGTKKRAIGSDNYQEPEAPTHGGLLLCDSRRGCEESI